MGSSEQILMEWLESSSLSWLWHWYLRPFFALSHVSMAFATYLIIAATLERSALPSSFPTRMPLLTHAPCGVHSLRSTHATG